MLGKEARQVAHATEIASIGITVVKAATLRVQAAPEKRVGVQRRLIGLVARVAARVSMICRNTRALIEASWLSSS
jgi:hypothetical protein